MVDYSKWDQLEVSSDEEDEYTSRDGNSGWPRVTKLKQSSRVTVQGDQVQVQPSDIVNAAIKRPPQEKKSSSSTSNVLSSKSSLEEKDSFCSRGSIEKDFLWMQDQEKVVVRIPIPASLSAKSISVQLDPKGVLKVSSDQSVLLERTLWHDVWGAEVKIPREIGISEEEMENKQMEWELESLPESLHREREDGAILSRCVSVTVYKHFPRLVRTIWWEKAFEGGEELPVDTQAFSERRGTSFTEAFMQAEQQFREKIGQQMD